VNKLDVLSRTGAEDRIKTFLRVIRRKNRKDIVNIGMNQTEFAKYLCMDRTTLTATLNKMRREGVIEFTKNEFILKFPEANR
jgi:DNA-binding MarR family transcriptional regulator